MESRQRRSKIEKVRIDSLRVPRAGVAQRSFHPAKGNRLALEFDIDSFGFPVVCHVDGVNWLVDGQHRIHGLQKSGYAQSTDDIGHPKTKGNVFSVGTLRRVYDRNGPFVLERVLRVLRDAYLASPAAFGRVLIDGLALVLGAYKHRIVDDVVVSALASEAHGVHGVHRRAEDYRERLGCPLPQCVAAAVVDVYNRKVGKKRGLLKWWKLQHLPGREVYGSAAPDRFCLVNLFDAAWRRLARVSPVGVPPRQLADRVQRDLLPSYPVVDVRGLEGVAGQRPGDIPGRV